MPRSKGHSSLLSCFVSVDRAEEDPHELEGPSSANREGTPVQPVPTLPEPVVKYDAGCRITEGQVANCTDDDKDKGARTLSVHTTIDYAHSLVEDMTGIVNAPYYWGALDRYCAEALLEGAPEGTFLLRDSAQPGFLFSISFRRYQRTLHARVEHSDNRFSFDIHDKLVFSARTLTEVIAHYKDPDRCMFFEPQLLIPLSRNFVFPLQHICRAVITDNLCTYDSISHLPIPRQLRDFLRQYHHLQPVRVTRHWEQSGPR